MNKQYTIIKLPIREIISQNYSVTFDEKTMQNYLVKQENSLLLDQIERLRGHEASHISELILVEARKNPRQEDPLCHILSYGFTYNGILYKRFGKSASQGKSGITAFLCENMYDELYRISQMGIPINRCVISKYEAQRCLIFSSCQVIRRYTPRIVIIGEYKKTLPRQFVKYVKNTERTFTEPETGKEITYTAKEIEEGYRNIPLSPFDGCGCHETEFADAVTGELGLPYTPVCFQVRMPFLKGCSVYVPFRKILKEWGVSTITDIYGNTHDIDKIDCIFNISMFKGHAIFSEVYGNQAWNAYRKTFDKYQFKLGISKHSHPVSLLNQKTRMNFQYLQCLNLWNPAYIASFEKKDPSACDPLNPEQQGKIIRLARYTTGLWEKILDGDLFYFCKFLGVTDTGNARPESRFLEAVLVNPAMKNDPAVRRFASRRLKKAIQEAKIGKIYADGFYHTITGDMIGYLEYAAGRKVVGCLRAGEFFCKTLDEGDCISFRSPLICPSEVNRITLTSNELTETWFSHFKDQDVAMINMYDLTLPQQGGADCDGDIVFLCNHPLIIDAKADKPIIIDFCDKSLAEAKPYTPENILEYERMTRDSRIGEITNIATSIENRYTADETLRKKYEDDASLLRLYQGHEIDYLKTGTRWQLSKRLQKYARQIPYFLLFHYPKKLEAYRKLKEKNYPPNAYRSPSPMNELCDYICAWEREHVLWQHDREGLETSAALIVNHNYDLSDRSVIRLVRRTVNAYADDLRGHLAAASDDPACSFDRNALAETYKKQLAEAVPLDEEHLANYVISVSYKNLSISKSFAWTGYGDYILKNLRDHTDKNERLIITEVPAPTKRSYEYLGKYYELLKSSETGGFCNESCH